jgi:DNA polymerase III subunit delta
MSEKSAAGDFFPIMKFNSDTLPDHLQQQLLAVYLISGDEPLLIAEATDAVRAKARASGFTERETHFMERGGDWNDVRASANNLSLFAERRIVEIRMPSAKPGNTGSAAIVALLQSKDSDRLLIITAPKLDRDAQGSEWVRAVETHGALVQVWPVEASRLVGWLRARAKRLRLNADDEALAIIAERTEGNLLAANQELEKLRLIAKEDRITADDVFSSVADSARFDVFQLGECALAGDTSRALRMIEGLRAEGVEPTLVLWSLSKSVRDLWGSVQGGGRMPAWKRQTAALEKGQRRAPQLHFGRLTARAVRADRMIKGRESGNAWDEMALLAMDICARPVMPLSRSVMK